jgi:hypothetical protein
MPRRWTGRVDLDNRHRRERRHAGEHVEQHGQPSPDTRPPAGGIKVGVLDHVEKHPGALAVSREERVFLSLEQGVEGRPGHASRLADVTDPCAGVAFAGDRVDEAVEQAISLGGRHHLRRHPTGPPLERPRPVPPQPRTRKRRGRQGRARRRVSGQGTADADRLSPLIGG